MLLKQEGFRDIEGASETAIILLSKNLHPELKILIYPACQRKEKRKLSRIIL